MPVDCGYRGDPTEESARRELTSPSPNVRSTAAASWRMRRSSASAPQPAPAPPARTLRPILFGHGQSGARQRRPTGTVRREFSEAVKGARSSVGKSSGNQPAILSGSMGEVFLHPLKGVDAADCGLCLRRGLDYAVLVRMWEISENLHRSDLDRMQRALHEAEWVRLAEEEALVGQVDPLKGPGKGRHSEGGIRKAARELPIKGDTEEAKRHRLRRDLKICRAHRRCRLRKINRRNLRRLKVGVKMEVHILAKAGALFAELPPGGPIGGAHTCARKLGTRTGTHSVRSPNARGGPSAALRRRMGPTSHVGVSLPAGGGCSRSGATPPHAVQSLCRIVRDGCPTWTARRRACRRWCGGRPAVEAGVQIGHPSASSRNRAARPSASRPLRRGRGGSRI